jgi:hypothetical protein
LGAFFSRRPAGKKTGLSVPIFFAAYRGKKGFRPVAFIYAKGFLGPLALLLYSPQHALACGCWGILQSLARTGGISGCPRRWVRQTSASRDEPNTSGFAPSDMVVVSFGPPCRASFLRRLTFKKRLTTIICMITIQETVTIPRDRHIHLDLTVPETVPCGTAQVMLVFAPNAEKSAVLEQFAPLKTLEDCKKEAAEKTAWRMANPEEFRATLRKFQESEPLFGGIDGMEFQKRCRDEWFD